MLRDIIEAAVQAQPDMELVEGQNEVDLEEAVQRGYVDVAIVASGAALCERAFLAKPELKVLVIAVDGGVAELLEFRRRSLIDPSPQSLLDAIRRAINDEEPRVVH